MLLSRKIYELKEYILFIFLGNGKYSTLCNCTFGFIQIQSIYLKKERGNIINSYTNEQYQEQPINLHSAFHK